MKVVPLLVVVFFIAACTSPPQDTWQTPETVEPSTSMPVPGTDTVETVVESTDTYQDLNTADDSFDAIDDALDALG